MPLLSYSSNVIHNPLLTQIDSSTMVSTPCSNIIHTTIFQRSGQFSILPNTQTREKLNVQCKSLFHNNRNEETEERDHRVLASTLSFFSTLFPSVESSLFNSRYLFSQLNAFFLDSYSNLVNPPPLHPSVDPNIVLAGNFAPVDEMPPTKCSIINGNLPPCLTGVYIRNGPNPRYQPNGPHHLFEGDGMLHSIRLLKGEATYCCRYVKTYKYMKEEAVGGVFFPKFFSGTYSIGDICSIARDVGKVMIGQINLLEGFGLANTSVAFFFDKLFALVETDLPYAVQFTQDGDIQTIGRYDFDGQVFPNMTAHPKIDPQTGEILAFRILPFYPYVTYFRFETNEVKKQQKKEVPVKSMKTPTFIHDFAITKRYVIFPDIQLHMALLNVVQCKGMPAYIDIEKIPRIGVLPRYAASDSEMKWFDVPGFNAIHIVNAWEEDEDTLVLVAPNCLHIENFLSSMEKLHFSMEKLRIDMKTGNIMSRKVLSEKSLELGSINSSYVGKRTRYVYMAICEQVPKMSGVVKIDLELGCEVGCRLYEDGWYGGEAYYVGREGGDGEDDGYVVSFVHNEVKGESWFVVMDAKSEELEIVATVKLPGRVPYGFHGLFVSEKVITKSS